MAGDAIVLALPPEPAAPAEARRGLGELAAALDEDCFADLQLLVTELITNSVRHGRLHPADRIEVLVRVAQGRVHAEVTDRGQGLSGGVSHTLDMGSGWGLYLVSRLAARWGCESEKGLRIWFDLECPGSA